MHDLTGDDLGMALVPMPIELGDEITVDGNPWPREVVNIVWAPAGAKVAAIVKGALGRAVSGLTSSRDGPDPSGARSAESVMLRVWTLAANLA